jgi:sugar transferase (PEP-CTERM/EpsH1 system associated)
VRVAYLCHRIPYPPNKGEKIRAFYQLRALSAKHEVDLFTLVDDAADIGEGAALAKYCRSVTAVLTKPLLARVRSLPYLLTRTPLTVPFFYSGELAARFKDAVSKRAYDRIFVYCSAMAQYVDGIDHIPIITDFVDVDSDKWSQYAAYTRFPMSIIYRREARFLRQYEHTVCRHSDSILVTTEREARLTREICDDGNVHVIVNGVDLQYFRPDAIPGEKTVPTIVFTGDMTYFPNEEAVISFAKKTLPIVHQTVPAARFLVIGRHPSAAVRRLGNTNGIKVTGFVPDVRTYLAKAHVSVAPFSIAAGIQNKILEAMAYSIPVVATRRAVQGLSERAAAVIRVADTPEDIAREVVGLLSDSELASALGAESRRRVADTYDWAHSLAGLMDIIENPLQTQLARATASLSVGSCRH